MSSNGRIDIVVFPNGGREIIGRIDSDPVVSVNDLIPVVNKQAAAQKLTAPKKFTGIYDPANINAITWSDYNESNPIVQVDKADLGIPYDSTEEEGMPMPVNHIETVSVELGTLPASIAEKYTENRNQDK